MRVLMFGWEFPPHITGGLGTACLGLTQGLAKKNVEIIFIVPKVFGDEDKSAIKLVAAEDIDMSHSKVELETFWRNIHYLEISSNIIPYVDPEEYQRLIEQSEFDKTIKKESTTTRRFKFSGKYGVNLMEEVTRYALIATNLAVNQKFDIIHAHDWLTYPAGIAAKMISGKPLVIHVHATEFDRSGENINKNVFEIERRGMELADRVITVSNLTRNIVITKYGIPEEKVTTVHNAVNFDNEFNADEFTKKVPEQIVTFLGRITYQKGPDYFVEAANKVLKKNKNVRFVMAGSGDMLNRMIRRVAELGISHKFHFTGFLRGRDRKSVV